MFYMYTWTCISAFQDVNVYTVYVDKPYIYTNISAKTEKFNTLVMVFKFELIGYFTLTDW